MRKQERIIKADNITWKDYNKLDQKYCVSINGEIYSYAKKKIIKGIPNSRGYLRVKATINGITTFKFIHRIVAETFIDNPNNELTINHKNEIKTDNRVENLEWCSYYYNNNYGTRNERISKTLKERYRQQV